MFVLQLAYHLCVIDHQIGAAIEDDTSDDLDLLLAESDRLEEEEEYVGPLLYPQTEIGSGMPELPRLVNREFTHHAYTGIGDQNIYDRKERNAQNMTIGAFILGLVIFACCCCGCGKSWDAKHGMLSKHAGNPENVCAWFGAMLGCFMMAVSPMRIFELTYNKDREALHARPYLGFGGT